MSSHVQRLVTLTAALLLGTNTLADPGAPDDVIQGAVTELIDQRYSVAALRS
jgi:hypothetical protein